MAMTNEQTTGHPSTRACGTCAAAKSKCVYRQETAGAKCERCHRLNKNCVVLPPVVRQRKPRRTTRVAQLEKKLDGIVSLLQASQNVGNRSSPGTLEIQPVPLTPEKSPSESNNLTVQQNVQQEHRVDGVELQAGENVGNKTGSEAPFTYLSNAPLYLRRSTYRYLLDYPSDEPDDGEADRIIRVYQEELTTQFPFVVLPPGTKAASLRESKPFLYMAIIMAASYWNLPRQTLFEKKIVEYLSENLILRSLKTLDLLQGLLVFCSWYHYHSLYHPQLTTFVQQAVALVSDLGLNRSPNALDRARFTSVRLAGKDAKDNTVKERTSEERRAVLGCFYLTSVVSTCFQKIDAIRFTPHMDECSQFLFENPEYPTDIYLAHLVQLKRIVERIAQSIYFHQWENKPASKAPIGLHIKVFQTELETFQASLPSELQQNKFLLMHYYTACMRLYEVALNAPSPFSTSVSTKQQCLNSADPAQVDALYALLTAVNSFVTTLLEIPAVDYMSMSFITWGQLSFALTTLARLSCPQRNLEFVKDATDYVTVLETFARKFEEIRPSLDARNHGLDDGKQYSYSFEKYAKKLRVIINMHQNRYKAQPAAEDSTKDQLQMQPAENAIQQAGWQTVPPMMDQIGTTTHMMGANQPLYDPQNLSAFDDNFWGLPGMEQWWDGNYQSAVYM